MEDKSLQAFLNGFSSPAWLIVAVGVPILTEWIINRLKALNSARISATAGPQQPAIPQIVTTYAAPRSPGFYGSFLNNSVRFIRPLFLLCLFPMFLLGLSGLFTCFFRGSSILRPFCI